MSDRTAPYRWLALALASLLASVVFAACGSSTTSASDAIAHTAQGFTNYTVTTAAGGVRSYMVHAPTGAIGPRPLVLVYHGAEGTAEGTEQETDFVEAADQNGYVVAFLQGYDGTWNEGAGGTPARRAGVNDVEFTADALAQIERNYSIDRTRVAAAGFSNGALLSELLGCRLAASLTLVVPVEGELPASVSPGCRPAKPISVLEFHGTADSAIPYGGGHFDGVGGGTTVLAAPANAARWASLDGCKRRGRTTDTTEATVFTNYSACRDQTVVVLRSIQGGTHHWPENVGVLVAQFLSQHPRPLAPAHAG